GASSRLALVRSDPLARPGSLLDVRLRATLRLGARQLPAGGRRPLLRRVAIPGEDFTSRAPVIPRFRRPAFSLGGESSRRDRVLPEAGRELRPGVAVEVARLRRPASPAGARAAAVRFLSVAD